MSGRHDAKSKVYEYRICNEQLRSPFLRNYAWHVQRLLDWQAMEECLKIIRGAHDFSSFCSGAENLDDPVRNMFRAELAMKEGNLMNFEFEANGFLRYMVRTIVGAIVKVGLGEMSVDRFQEIVESSDRQHPGVKAPPWGLYLTDVKY